MFGEFHIIAHTSTRVPNILFDVVLDFITTHTEHEGQSPWTSAIIDFFLDKIDLLANCNSG